MVNVKSRKIWYGKNGSRLLIGRKVQIWLPFWCYECRSALQPRSQKHIHQVTSSENLRRVQTVGNSCWSQNANWRVSTLQEQLAKRRQSLKPLLRSRTCCSLLFRELLCFFSLVIVKACCYDYVLASIARAAILLSYHCDVMLLWQIFLALVDLFVAYLPDNFSNDL